MPATSQLDWLISMTAMIVLFWSRATRDLLRSFGWGIAALHRYMQRRSCHPRRPPHSVSRSPVGDGIFRALVHSFRAPPFRERGAQLDPAETTDKERPFRNMFQGV